MIEAVNASLANAQILRGNAEGANSVANVASSANTAPAEPRDAPQVPQAPYVSPYIAIDLDNNTAVLQIRDSETGEVEQQYPSETRLRQQAREAAREAAPSGIREPVSSDSSSIITVQDVTSAPVSNVQGGSAQAATPPQQSAISALSAGAQVPAAGSNLSVLA